MKPLKLIAAAGTGIAAWTGIGAALAAGYLAYVVGVSLAAVAIWLLGWALGLWMRGSDR